MIYSISTDAPDPPVWGQIVASASEESGGAVQSLRWQNIKALGGATKEYIDAFDHGRLLQCALSFDNAGEAYNPTEGGARNDGGVSKRSTSRVMIKASGNVLETMAQLAYWDAYKGATVSNVTLRKRVTLRYGGIWNAVELAYTLNTPQNETHTLDQFEFATGYMPAEFSVFETLDRATGVLSPLDDTPGEQPMPLVFSTPDAKWAMGVWAPEGTPGGGYGRWRVPGGFMGLGACVKWNAVQRVNSPLVGAVLTGRVIVALGDRAGARQTLCALAS